MITRVITIAMVSSDKSVIRVKIVITMITGVIMVITKVISVKTVITRIVGVVLVMAETIRIIIVITRFIKLGLLR